MPFLPADAEPEMKTALNKVQSKGGMKHTEFNDLSVMDFSYGFEVFRGIVINLELSDIHVTAETK